MARDSKRISVPRDLHARLEAAASIVNGGRSLQHFLVDVVEVIEAIGEAQRIEVLFPHKAGVPVQVICHVTTEERTA